MDGSEYAYYKLTNVKAGVYPQGSVSVSILGFHYKWIMKLWLHQHATMPLRVGADRDVTNRLQQVSDQINDKTKTWKIDLDETKYVNLSQTAGIRY